MRRTVRRGPSGYRRTALVGVASSALLIAGLGSATGQETDAPFSNGTAKATAVVARVAPGVGALELGISAGVAVSEIKNTIGQAQSETLDLGLIGSTLTGEGCDGSDPTISPENLPQSTRVDSRGGDVSITEDEFALGGSTIGGGRKQVSALTRPAASAATTVVATLGELLTLDGGRADAVTEVIPGEARFAHASVGVDLNIGGFLKLSGLRWDAVHRTGTNPEATASFDIGTASLLGIPIPLDALEATEGIVNQILAASGVQITFPKVERFTEPADVIRITPLRIVLSDTPIGKAVLGPVLNLSRAQREQLFDDLAAAYCDFAGYLLIGDIAVSVASGTGFLAVELGGAEATTGELVLEDPFGDDEAPPVSLAPAIPVSGGPVVAPRVPSVALPPTAPPTPVADIGPLEEHCESAHTKRSLGCSEGALMALGLAGLGATVAVGALDYRHQRRRRAAVAVAGGIPT
jgi:hypothetical protein